jgi:hypothetical protein
MLPKNAEGRKAVPIATGVLDYFPGALAEVARVSKAGNDQHNPGEPLHWAKEKSTDEADALVRHLLERGTYDTDGMRHSAKMAWRALALLQRELDAEAAPVPSRDALDEFDAETERLSRRDDLHERPAKAPPPSNAAARGGYIVTTDYELTRDRIADDITQWASDGL